MFIDTAKIYIQAGKGGDGAVSFHREKYVNAGGPDGGDGGKGGDIVFVADPHFNTLMDFRYKRKYAAAPGENGSGNNCSGAKGKDLVIRVPRGTLIRDAASGALMKDLSDDQPFVAAKGGRGGWGNQHFATSTRQIPRFAKPGQAGESFEIQLELKLIADVGLLGYPNVGKSTLLSRVSKATPKIANYHFTTLAPNLGVVELYGETSFVMADIPGIIEGASAGVGLGHDFLRHVERCRLLLHVVDISQIEGRDPLQDFETLQKELEQYSSTLAALPQIVVGNKADIMQDACAVQQFKEHIEKKGLPYFEISAATNQGLEEVMQYTAARLEQLPKCTVFEADYVPVTVDEALDKREINTFKRDGIYYIEGAWVQKIMESVNFSDGESLRYFERVLRSNDVFEKLEELGIQEGDTVQIYDFSFEYIR